MKKMIKGSKAVTAGARIYLEDIDEFEPWGQAEENLEIIQDNDKMDEFEQFIADSYPDGISVTGLNDILAYDWEYVFEYLGIDGK